MKYLIIVLLIIFAIFLVQNMASVTVSFLIYDVTMPRALLLIFTLALGIIVGILLPIRLSKGR